MSSIEFRVDTRDIQFLLFEQLAIQEELLKLEAFQDYDQETVSLVVEELIKFAVTELGPTNRKSDLEEAVYKDGNVTIPESMKRAYKIMCEAGWTAPGLNPEYGGGGFPELIAMVFREVITGANTSFSLFMILNQGAGHLIEAFGDESQRATYVEKMYTGEWGGTMCLTEPHAGSDLSACTTTATPEGDHYLLKGTKIFITNGEQDVTDNIIHTVLARTPGSPAGTKGISLFLVPKFLVNEDGSLGARNDVRCERIEHKMGIKASPTCVMGFGEQDQCKGWLIGNLNQGMLQMFQMMNEARLGVGAQGLANGAAAYMSALGYAIDRRQGAHIKRFKDPTAPRAEIISHPDIRRMMMTMKAYVEGIRALIYASAVYIDMAKHHEDPAQREHYMDLVELLTPVCKAYGSDMGFKVTELAVQTYGGYGFTQEYPVELYMRDAKIASLYEGTNGIQAMDLVARKLKQFDGRRFHRLIEHTSAILAAGEGHALQPLVTKMLAHQKRLMETTQALVTKTREEEPTHGLANACPYLDMVGNFAAGVFLTQGAIIAHDKLAVILQTEGVDQADDAAFKALLKRSQDAAFYHTKICTARFFQHHILIHNDALAQTIQEVDRSAMDAFFYGESELAFT